MKRRRACTLFELLPQLIIIMILAAILFPVFSRARENARRASCQSNLKQIGLAALQYAQDYDDHLPLRSWAPLLAPYARTSAIFQCPATSATTETTDYFWNARFFGRDVDKIKSPPTLILAGEGYDDAPLEASLTRLPPAWIHDEDSPAWRHLETANYLFADGHVKSFKARAIDMNFRLRYYP